jgi:hypothetical protein
VNVAKGVFRPRARSAGMAAARPLAICLLLAALLAGCAAESPDLFGPVDASASAQGSSQAAGVTLTVRVRDDGDRLRIHAEGTNGGSSTLQVPGACMDHGRAAARASPFSIAARRTVTPQGSASFPISPESAACNEVSTRPFGPGETLRFDLAWDGRFDSETFGRIRVLPGDHAVDVTLELYAGPSGSPVPVTVSVPFVVLDVGQ